MSEGLICTTATEWMALSTPASYSRLAPTRVPPAASTGPRVLVVQTQRLIGRRSEATGVAHVMSAHRGMIGGSSSSNLPQVTSSITRTPRLAAPQFGDSAPRRRSKRTIAQASSLPRRAASKGGGPKTGTVHASF